MFGRKRDKNDAYRHLVSLGKTCQPALHMERNNLRVASYPLDWILSPTDSLCTLLATRFDQFFDKPLLAPQKLTAMNTLEVHHRKLGLVYAHEFKNEASFHTDYDRWKETYDRRIDRLYTVLNGTERVLFVRFRVTREDALKISGTLSSLFPNLPCTLLCVDDTPEVDQEWGIPGVISRRIQAAPEEDAGSRKYNPAWKKLFREFPFDLPKTEKPGFLSGRKSKFSH